MWRIVTNMFLPNQVVWKSTKKLGVGIASIKRGFWTTTYIVARYTPPGNYEGKFKQEVGSIMALKWNGKETCASELQLF